MLRQTGLDRTALGQDWIEASDASLQTAVTVSTPFQETGYFSSAEAMAVSYRMDLQRGRRLSIEVSFESTGPAQLFADLFQLSDEGPPRRVSFLEAEQSSFLHDVERDGSYLLRLQPELLRGGRFTLTQRTLASLRFPISGLTTRTVQSAFGADRDAGAREHEGIDIFVPRGTPAIAVASGLARSGANALGGTVVWLHEPAAGRTFYYAHLDDAAIDGVQYVREGEVVGYVGNTGNARSTSPHLHFGIYDQDAIDPLPFLRPDDPTPATPERANAHLGDLVRVAVARASLRAGPALDQPRLALLGKNAVARVLGSSTVWLRVSLPGDTIGYISADLVGPADTPVRLERLSESAALREGPLESSPIVDVLEAGVRVDVLGSFEEYDLLRGPNGRTGWVNTRRLKSADAATVGINPAAVVHGYLADLVSQPFKQQKALQGSQLEADP